MILTGQEHFHPNKTIYRTLDLMVNLLRSFPFIILMIAIIPLTRMIAGTSIGSTADNHRSLNHRCHSLCGSWKQAFSEVDKGVIEAASAFGATNWQILTRVMVREALPAIILNIAVIAINLLGYSAMAGCRQGGLGDLAIKYGYNRFQTDVMIYSVAVLIVVIVQI